MRVGIYTRISCSSENIENQIEPLKQYCLNNKYKYKIYSDICSGYSGKGDPPGLKRLIQDCNNGKIDMVAFYRLDRLGRRGIRSGIALIEKFRLRGIKLYSHSEPFLQFNLMDDAFQELTMTILLWMGKQESRLISERIRNSYDRKLKQSEEQGNSIEWGRRPGSFTIPIDLEKVKEIISEDPAIGYGKLAVLFTYWDSKARKKRIPSRSGVKARLKKLGVIKKPIQNPNGKKSYIWVFKETTD